MRELFFLQCRSTSYSSKELIEAREVSLAACKLCAIARLGLREADIHLFVYEAFIPKVLDITYQER